MCYVFEHIQNSKCNLFLTFDLFKPPPIFWFAHKVTESTRFDKA